MTINIIDKKMIVQNKIELHPSINYVSASSDCNFLDRLEITQAGTYGFINSTNTDIKEYKEYTVGSDAHDITRQRQYNVSDAFVRDTSVSLLTKITNLKSNILALESELKTKLVPETSRNNNFITSFCVDKGVQFNTAGKHQFEVERIEKEYLIDSQSYRKKLSVLNLYEFYRENIEHNSFHDLSWGFKNYNSLNFFNIYENINSKFSNSITHKNCLIYPNLLSQSKQTYDFTDAKDFSISFYINPKRKNKDAFHYNPGCIINIPGIVSVYIVKGTSVDEKGLTDKFRILTQTGEKTYEALFNTVESSSFDFTDESEQSAGLNYLSKDNILSHNNWHHVALAFRKNTVNNSTTCYFEIFVDGVLISTLSEQDNVFLQQSNNSFITIGNKILVEKADISDFVLNAFSKDLTNADDNLGPYVKKHILFGNQIDSVLNGVSDPSKTYDFKNNLNDSNSSYINENTSMALNAEICDIRLYKQSLDAEKVLNITKKGINSIDYEKDEYDLIFYLPVYFKSQNVKRQGLVNLNAPYRKTIDNDISVPVDEYLEGKYIYNNVDQNVDENNFKIKTENISYNSATNPFFFTFTGGTEVSAEHFTREFVFNTQPNIVIGGNIKEDSYQNCFLSKASFVLDNADFNNKIKEGKTADTFLLDIYNEASIDNTITINSLKTNADIDHQVDTIIYKNYMILPSDNGLQEQFYNNDVFKYNLESDYLDIHKNDVGEINYDFVSLNNIKKDFNLKSSISARLLTIPEYYNRDELTPLEERREFYITNSNVSFINEKRFNEFPDKLKNISLNNYHSEFNLSFVDNVVSSNISAWRKSELSLASKLDLNESGDFYKTFSNPAQRSYYSSHDNTISQLENYDQKLIGQESSIIYWKAYSPLWQLEEDYNENSSTIFCISTQIFNNKIKKETFTIKDVDLPLSSGVSLFFKDSSLGTMYRCDSLTKSAEWNTSGHVLYNEGICTLLHPSLYNFGLTNFKIEAKSHASLNVFELNLPAHAGETNLSKNKSYIEDLRIDNSAFNSDEDFVYITDIDIHDENLNVVAKAKLAQPFPKKNSDNVLFRVKMDF
jgi:hypothetical protein